MFVLADTIIIKQTAVRIIKTARQVGIRTVSVYTAADAASSHVAQADEAVLLSGSDSTAYTDGEQIVRIAKEKKADAVIPGYGFLSENSEFAKAVGEAGLVWVGPSPESIDGMYRLPLCGGGMLMERYSIRHQTCSP